MQDYRSISVWQKAHSLAVGIRRDVRLLPSSERVQLGDHMKKTADSISFNIAEGFGRDSHAELARFLVYARGSANELEAQLLVARDSHCMAPERADRLLESVAEVRVMLTGLLREVRRQAATGSPWDER